MPGDGPATKHTHTPTHTRARARAHWILLYKVFLSILQQPFVHLFKLDTGERMKGVGTTVDAARECFALLLTFFVNRIVK